VLGDALIRFPFSLPRGPDRFSERWVGVTALRGMKVLSSLTKGDFPPPAELVSMDRQFRFAGHWKVKSYWHDHGPHRGQGSEITTPSQL